MQRYNGYSASVINHGGGLSISCGRSQSTTGAEFGLVRENFEIKPYFSFDSCNYMCQHSNRFVCVLFLCFDLMIRSILCRFVSQVRCLPFYRLILQKTFGRYALLVHASITGVSKLPRVFNCFTVVPALPWRTEVQQYNTGRSLNCP
jgi:hypothetical protein